MGPGSILRLADYGLATRKVALFEFAVAERLVETLGRESLLLAPEEVSAWVTVIEGAPAVVEGRSLYASQRLDTNFSENLRARAVLFDAWTAHDYTDVNGPQIVALANQVDVSAILFDTRRRLHMSAEQFLAADGFTEVWEKGSYRLFAKMVFEQ